MPPRVKGFVFFLVYAAASNLLGWGIGALVVAAHLFDVADRSWHPSVFLIGETAGALGSFFATWIVVALSGWKFSRLGYRAEHAWRDFLIGSLFGLTAVVILVGAIAALGGFTFGTIAMSGPRLAQFIFAWLAAMLMIGVAEEMDFRAAGLLTLAEAIGFWPAAIALSALFGAVHYFFKPMENLADALSVGLLGLFLCFTVLRSGAIWFAIGFHALFDYAALYVFGAPNSGNGGRPIATRLLTGTYHGPAWLTGGPLGVEASWLAFPLIALLFLSFSFLYRALGYNPPHSVQENSGGTA
jgi:CAAX protease family protein